MANVISRASCIINNISILQVDISLVRNLTATFKKMVQPYTKVKDSTKLHRQVYELEAVSVTEVITIESSDDDLEEFQTGQDAHHNYGFAPHNDILGSENEREAERSSDTDDEMNFDKKLKSN